MRKRKILRINLDKKVSKYGKNRMRKKADQKLALRKYRNRI